MGDRARGHPVGTGQRRPARRDGRRRAGRTVRRAPGDPPVPWAVLRRHPLLDAHPDRIAKNIAEHTEILEALRAGDAAAATDAVHRHVSWVRNLAQGNER